MTPAAASYVLVSERLGFRCWAPGDFPLAMALWGDADVTRMISREPWTEEDVRRRLATEIETQALYGIQYWPMFELTTGDFVGCCGIRPHDDIHEVGIHLLHSQWGKGYADEATQAVIAYAFEHIGVMALYAGHNPANEGSRHILRKAGFRYTHDVLYPPTGLMHPSYLMTREEYFSAR